MITIIFISLALVLVSSELGSASMMEEEVVPLRLDHEQEIRDALEAHNVQPFVVELLVAQSKHESGNYKNNLAKYHNVFARHYHKIDTFAISKGARAEGHSNFAIYPSLKNATLSQLSYLKRKNYSFKWKSTREFALELKSKAYYEATVDDYVAALNSYMPN